MNTGIIGPSTNCFRVHVPFFEVYVCTHVEALVLYSHAWKMQGAVDAPSLIPRSLQLQTDGFKNVLKSSGQLDAKMANGK